MKDEFDRGLIDAEIDVHASATNRQKLAAGANGCLYRRERAWLRCGRISGLLWEAKCAKTA